MTATYFQCPACGRSFEVASDRSERIFCGSKCASLGRAAEGRSPNPAENLAAGVGEARPAEPPPSKTVEMPVAMENAAVYWRKDSVGADAREVDEKVRRQDAEADWKEAEREAARLREQLDAATDALQEIAGSRADERHTVDMLTVTSYEYVRSLARAALGDVAAAESSSGSALDQRAVETRGGDS